MVCDAYLYPLISSTPFLRVRVPDIGTARSPACLRQRIAEQFPQAKELLQSESYTYFSRKLLEQGVVTYTIKHMKGCLSPAKSADWTREHRGVEVPLSRLHTTISF